MKRLLALPLVIIRLLVTSGSLALGQIWANKTRSILTTIGIVIGVASVTAVIATLSGLKTKVLTEIRSFGTNNIYIGSMTPDRGPLRHAPCQRIRQWQRTVYLIQILNAWSSLKKTVSGHPGAGL